MASAMRLSAGGGIDRSKPLRFTFNGRGYSGYEGDTLASALLANGVHLVGRSFKYHRPRGIMSAGIEETNALVQLRAPRDEPNVQATRLALTDGLVAHSINCWPSVGFDLGAMNSLLSPIFPAGFYYKTFMWLPWKSYAGTIRKFAGLGVNPSELHRGHYEKRYHHCDLLVVGAGPAGLSAALTAARGGARVMLVDDQPSAGGDLLNRPVTLNGLDAAEWVRSVISELSNFPNVTHLQNTLAAGYYDHNLITIVERSPRQSWVTERFWKVRASQVILATGSIERPMMFPDNDRPGVMLTSAAATYAYRYGVKVGNRAVVATNNNSAYSSAFLLQQSGVEVAAIIDQRGAPPAALLEQAEQLNIPVYPGQTISGVSGLKAVTAVQIGGQDQSKSISCDLICSSGGWNPAVHLHSQSGAKPVYQGALGCFIPGQSVQQETSVGSSTGEFSLDQCLQQGAKAANDFLIQSGKSAIEIGLPSASSEAEPELEIEVNWSASDQSSRGKTFVDFQNDVTTADIDLALRENYVSVEHVKRYTTAGMATDQGKSGNTNVIGYIAAQQGLEPGEVGTTTYRPPYAPISFGAIGGSDKEELIIPIRRTPLTQWHIDNGASINEAGANYRRPFWYPSPGESDHDAIMRAAKAVRTSVGVYDGSPLGKFELFGADVEKLLNLVYTNRFDGLMIGQGRFGMMLQEDGRLLDDGVTFRLDENRWLMSTGTGTADLIYAHLERLLQIDYPDWQVYITTVTNHWANICLCGPDARTVLQKAGTDIDLNTEKFPFLGMKQGTVAGIAARVARVSYTGELSYEVNVQRRDAAVVWAAILQAGEAYNITPVGSETSAVLRIEKGFVSAGSEGDNITNPFDAGMGWVVDMEKPDFIGKRTLQRDLEQSFVRQQVVGLFPKDPSFVPAEGSALIIPGADKSELFQGHVTASCYSPNLNRPICLALLKNGRSRMGETITISGLERSVEAEVTKPVFYDPKAERMKS